MHGSGQEAERDRSTPPATPPCVRAVRAFGPCRSPCLPYPLLSQLRWRAGFSKRNPKAYDAPLQMPCCGPPHSKVCRQWSRLFTIAYAVRMLPLPSAYC